MKSCTKDTARFPTTFRWPIGQIANLPNWIPLNYRSQKPFRIAFGKHNDFSEIRTSDDVLDLEIEGSSPADGQDTVEVW